MPLVTTSMGGNQTVTTPSSSSGPAGVVLTDNFIALANAMFAQVGMVFDFAGPTAPTGYLLCNGSEVSQATYAELFAIIGSTYGTPVNPSNFVLPDLRARITQGVNPSAIGTGDTERFATALADTGGESRHTQTIAELPDHVHPNSTPSSTVNVTPSGSTPVFSGALGDSGQQGSGESFNLLQPYLTLNKIIKY